MVTITLCGQKGGAGKTTVATNLIPEFLLRGLRVLLVDADVQGSARTWADKAWRAGLPAPAIAVVKGNTARRYDEQAVALWLTRDLPELVVDFDVTVIDCPGRLTEGRSVQSAALRVTDIAIVPAAEDAFSAWSLAATAELVQQAQRLRPRLQAFGLVEGVDMRRSIGKKAREHIVDAGLPALAAEILDRAEYVEAPGFLKGASTYKPSSEAADEVRALADELQTIWRPDAKETTRNSPRKAADAVRCE